jgi:DNA-binding LacI/PurR family transcriptional regulator
VPLDPEAAARAVRDWRERAEPITGVCAYNDEVAMAVLAGLPRLDLAAPADVAVVGVDDIPAARVASPPLTTVTTDMPAVAAHLAATVVAAIAGQPEPAPPGSDIVGIIRRASA